MDGLLIPKHVISPASPLPQSPPILTRQAVETLVACRRWRVWLPAGGGESGCLQAVESLVARILTASDDSSLLGRSKPSNFRRYTLSLATPVEAFHLSNVGFTESLKTTLACMPFVNSNIYLVPDMWSSLTD